MNNPTMLYKAPGPHKLHGVMCDYKTFDEADVEAALTDGWHKSPTEAGEATSDPAADDVPGDDDEISREEVLQKADELGISYSVKARTKTILKAIQEKLKGE